MSLIERYKTEKQSEIGNVTPAKLNVNVSNSSDITQETANILLSSNIPNINKTIEGNDDEYRRTNTERRQPM